MQPVEQYPCAGVSQKTASNGADDKSRSGVIAKAQYPQGIFLAALPLLIQRDSCPCSQWIPPHGAQQDSGGTTAREPKQPPHGPFQQRRKTLCHPQ